MFAFSFGKKMPTFSSNLLRKLQNSDFYFVTTQSRRSWDELFGQNWLDLGKFY